MWPTVSSAAEMMFDVGALTTMTPAVVADLMSTLSRPTPARAITLRVLRGRDGFGVHLRRRADEHGGGVGERGEQRRAVGAVHVAHLEVGPEGLDGCWGEFFGDHNDRLSHEFLSFGRRKNAKARV